MTYSITFSAEAMKDIKCLDTVVKKRLQKKLVEISASKDITAVSKRLVSHEAGEYCVRFGDYRIIFDLLDYSVFILRVRHRKEVYR